MVVPGDSAPANEVLPLVTAVPVTVMVKPLATALPPLSLITCLITVRCAACRVFVKVQLMISPSSAMIVAVRVPRVVVLLSVCGRPPGSSVQTRAVSANAGAGSASATVRVLVEPNDVSEKVLVFDRVASEGSSSSEKPETSEPVVEKLKSCGSSGTAFLTIVRVAGKMTASDESW